MSKAAVNGFVVALTLAAAAVQTAAPAVAKVTTTSVKTTSAAAHELVGAAGPTTPTNRRFAGTSDGTIGDQLDLAAQTEDGSIRILATGIAVAKNGAWSWQGPIDPIVTTEHANPSAHRALKVAAAPTGSAAQLASPAWRGTAVAVSTWSRESSGSPAWINNYHFAQLGSAGWNDYEGFDSCGLCDGGRSTHTGAPAPALWIWNGSVDGPSQTRSSGGKSIELPSISVDGVAAYASFFAAVMSPNSSFVPKAAFKASVDKSTGQATIREHHQLTRCSTFPVLIAADCSVLIDTGVVLDRKIVQSADGATVAITDVVSSSDGRTHNWEIHYINAIRRGPGAVAWRLPGALTWLPATPSRSKPDSVPDWSIAPRPADATTVTLGVRSSYRSAASLTNPQGSISITPRPLRLWFPSASADRTTIDMAGRVNRATKSTNSFVYQLSTK